MEKGVSRLGRFEGFIPLQGAGGTKLCPEPFGAVPDPRELPPPTPCQPHCSQLSFVSTWLLSLFTCMSM